MDPFARKVQGHDEFWQQVVGRLSAQERSIAWLGRRLRITRSALSNYLHGHRPTPDRVRREVMLLLDIRDQTEAAA